MVTSTRPAPRPRISLVGRRSDTPAVHVPLCSFGRQDASMPSTKGVQRRRRGEERANLVLGRFWVPKDQLAAVKKAAAESNLAEGLYMELLLNRLAEQSGTLPRFTLTTDQELPIADVA